MCGITIGEWKNSQGDRPQRLAERWRAKVRIWHRICLETDGTDIDEEDIFQNPFQQKDLLQIIMISDRMGARAPISS